MGRYRTINVNLDRGYRNDLNHNFQQIEEDIAKTEVDIKKVESETLEKVNEIVGGGFIESLEIARDAANASATEANTQAAYAKTQGDNAGIHGEYAQVQGDYAKSKGDYADEKALLASQAAGKAEQEVSNLGQLKIDVVNATQGANTAAGTASQKATEADTAAANAINQGDYAKAMGDYAKTQGDAVNEIIEGKAVTSVNGKSGAVVLTASDVEAITLQDAQTLANQAEENAKNASVSKTELGVAGGAARLNTAGKVIDADGNEVEGAVKSVNGQTGEVEITDVASANDASKLGGQLPTHYATAQSVTDVSNNIDNLSNNIDNLNDKLTKTNGLSVDLNRGLQVVTVNQDTPVNVLNLTGRTIINYAPLFDSGLWTFHANVTVNSPNKVTLNATATEQNSYIHKIFIKENTNYSLKVKHNGKILLGFYDSTDKLIANTGWVSIENTTLLAPTGTTHARVTFSSTGAGTFTFENVSLNEGTTAQPFVANIKGITNPTIENKAIDESITLLGTFHDGETVNSDGTVTRKKKEVVLDGSLNWQTDVINSVGTGYKSVKFSYAGVFNLNNNQMSDCIVKYNGKILHNPNNDSLPYADTFIKRPWENNTMYIAISNTDTGFGQDYSPKAEEWKAYFMGWRMANTSVGWDEPYNGTGTKGWYRIDDNGNKADGTNTLPTIQATINSKWQPYRLIYELETPVTEQLESIGGISLIKGDNQIEMSESRIVRERVKAVLSQDGLNYETNHMGFPGFEESKFNYKIDEKIQFYKNGEPDYYWDVAARGDAYSYGNMRFIIKKSNYDPTAIYEVDYIPLEPYKISAPTNPIIIEYQGNIGSVISELVELSTKQTSDIKELNRSLDSTERNINNIKNKNGDLTTLTTENKNTLVDAINEVNAKPNGGGGDDAWELIATHDLSPTTPLYTLYQSFTEFKRLKFILKSLAVHNSHVGSVAAGMLNMSFTDLSFGGYVSAGYRINMMSSSTITSLYTVTRRTLFPLLSTNIPSTTTYPHLETSGTIELNKSWWKSNQNYGFMPRRLWVDTELRVKDPNSSTMNRFIERASWEFPVDLNNVYPARVGITTDRPQGFTTGTIEIWGVKGDANDV